MAVNPESCDSLPPDEEPKLKYDRLGNDVVNILSKDAVSSIRVHPKFICLGTQWGALHLLDHEGNTVAAGAPGTAGKAGAPGRLPAHAVAVNAISVDQRGDFVASCSDDGKVLVSGLYADDNSHNLNLGRVVKSVALDPSYYKSGSGRRFLTGDNKLTLYEKTFLNRLRASVLCECEGYVQAMAWHERFVAWASEVGVRVYDLDARCSLGLIQWEKNPSRSIEDYRCNLLWSAPKTLMIGWVDTIRICVIRKRNQIELKTRDDTEYLVDPVYTFQTDYYISGLGPLDEQLVVLGVPKEPDPDTLKAQRPVLAVADYKDCQFSEVSTDCLNIRGYDEYCSNDYHLDALIEENRFFIVSPKDIIVASPYELSDRVSWLAEHGRYEQALAALEAAGAGAGAGVGELHALGARYLQHLMARGLFPEAAVLCTRICKSNRALWETNVLKFAEVNQLRAISPYVPRTPEQALGSHIYELIFYEYLKVDPPGFLKLVKEWNPALYKTDVVIKGVLEHVLTTEVDKGVYLEALALLYCHQRKYDKALNTYLKLRHPDVFALIAAHQLYGVIHDKILELMTLDADRTIDILLGHKKCAVPVEVVERQLARHDALLFRFLDAYARGGGAGGGAAGGGARWHGRLVRLYARFAPERLLPFLRSSDSYPIQEALDVCAAAGLHRELVFLLGRIGNTAEALAIIMERLGDIHQAIAFCQEHNDPELWAALVRLVVREPAHVTLLLQRIGNYVDPRMLIEHIPAGQELAGLQGSLAKMMRDYRLQVSVQQACKALTLRNYFELHARLVGTRSRALRVHDEAACGACGGRLLARDPALAADLLVFACRHSFHAECLPPAAAPAAPAACSVCSAGADAAGGGGGRQL